MPRNFSYLQSMSLNQLYDEYEKAEQYDDIALAIRIMEECENREYEDWER